MQSASRKKKGRKLQNKVRDDLREMGKEFGLVDDDLCARQMGGAGVDIICSPSARRVFPFDIECKNQEALNVFAEFTKHYAKYKKTKNLKLLIHSKNHSDTLVTMRWKTFLNLFGTYLDGKE